MLTAFVTSSSSGLVQVSFDSVSVRISNEEGTPVSAGPNPIAPEIKELTWGAGSFIVFLFIMRLFLVPKVRKGMASRYESIQADHEYASATRDHAKQDVAQYESAIAEIRVDAAKKLEQARQTLDSERQAKLGQVNEQIAQRRLAAESEVAASRLAAQSQIVTAVCSVASRITQLAVGVLPDPVVVRQSVEQAMEGSKS